jgi:hypothetical protein
VGLRRGDSVAVGVGVGCEMVWDEGDAISSRFATAREIWI